MYKYASKQQQHTMKLSNWMSHWCSMSDVPILHLNYFSQYYLSPSLLTILIKNIFASFYSWVTFDLIFKNSFTKIERPDLYDVDFEDSAFLCWLRNFSFYNIWLRFVAIFIKTDGIFMGDDGLLRNWEGCLDYSRYTTISFQLAKLYPLVCEAGFYFLAKYHLYIKLF